MIIIYDTEDLKTDPNYLSFLDRNPASIKHERTPAANQRETRKWVNQNNKAADAKDHDKIYKHYVPYDQILTAINNYVGWTQKRSQLLEWLEKVADELKIERAGIVDKSRAGYDYVVDYYVSSICDWQENIFRGASGGDGRGTKWDIPKNQDLAETMEEAAKTLLTALKF